MLQYLMIGGGLVAVTVTMHAFGSTWWVSFLALRYLREDVKWSGQRMLTALMATVILLIGLHLLQIIAWAVIYRLLVPGELESFEKAFYFSIVTFTTLGYGDITLTEGWRLLSGIEALNGILLVGWSTAMLFAVVQRSWSSLNRSARTARKQE